MKQNLPTRALREHPDLDQLKRQAKELLEAFAATKPGAVAEVNAHYRDADPANFALHDLQLVLARAYGFDSWTKLKAHVDGVTIKFLVATVRAGNLAQTRALLKVRPELAHMSTDNLQVLHHAVLNQSPEMVRVLMEHGANAREGVYPHRDATSALAIATERGMTKSSPSSKKKSSASAKPRPDSMPRRNPMSCSTRLLPAIANTSLRCWTRILR